MAVKVNPISGFAGTVAIDFPNLPPGFTVTGGNVAAGAMATFPIQNTLPPSATIFQITIRGRFGTDVQSSLLFVQVVATLPIARGLKISSTTVFAVEPAKLKAGDVVEGKIFGSNLGGVSEVHVSGSGIKAELLEALPSELRVRFTVDSGLEAGSRLITVRAGGRKATATIDVSTAAGKIQTATLAATPKASNHAGSGHSASSADANDSRKAPDLRSRSADSTEQDDRHLSRGEDRLGKSYARTALRQRGELQLTVGSCTGFGLSSAGACSTA